MAIQLRRGEYEDFDKTKMQEGELAVVTSGDPNTVSGQAMYICFGSGAVERIITYGGITGTVEIAPTQQSEKISTSNMQRLNLLDFELPNVTGAGLMCFLYDSEYKQIEFLYNLSAGQTIDISGASYFAFLISGPSSSNTYSIKYSISNDIDIIQSIADLNAGMAKYEDETAYGLIREDTLSEDVSLYIANETADGGTFKYRDIKIVIENNSNAELSIFHSLTDGSVYQYIMPAGEPTYYGPIVIEYQLDENGWYTASIYQSANGGIKGTYSTNKMEYCSGIQLSGSFTSGTKILVYGRRKL